MYIVNTRAAMTQPDVEVPVLGRARKGPERCQRMLCLSERGQRDRDERRSKCLFISQINKQSLGNFEGAAHVACVEQQSLRGFTNVV